MKTNWGSEGIARLIFNFGTRWRWLVSFMPRLLYPRAKRSRHRLDRRLGDPQSLCGRCGEYKKSHLCPYHPASSLLFKSTLL